MSRELVFSLTKKDFEITYFSGSGAGGQHRNKHMNCVRLYHPASGVRVTGQSEKSRKANIREAIDNLRSSAHFKMWLAGKIIEVETGKTLEQRVEEMCSPENLKIEVRDEDGKWAVME